MRCNAGCEKEHLHAHQLFLTVHTWMVLTRVVNLNNWKKIFEQSDTLVFFFSIFFVREWRKGL